MKEKIEDINFNLTSKMAKILVDFNNIKKEVLQLKELYKNNNDKELLIKIESLELELIKKRNLFIKEFRLKNLKEIKEYLDIKKQYNTYNSLILYIKNSVSCILYRFYS